MGVHAKLSPSAGDKWFNCAGARALEHVFAPEEEGANEFADPGTAAHEVGELSLKGRKKGIVPADFLGSMIKVNAGKPYEVDIECDEEMVEAVEKYVNHVLSHGGTLYVEERVDYSKYVPQGFGTSDAITEVEEMDTDREGNERLINTLYVDDLKYGKGIVVSAYESKQGMMYGLGALESLGWLFAKNIERIVVTIIQPRKDHISEWTIWVDDLVKWAEDELSVKAELAWELLQKAEEAEQLVDEDGYVSLSHLKPEHFCPGTKTCQWCGIKRMGKCKAQAMKGYEAAYEGFEDLTEEQRADITEIPVTKEKLKDVNILTNEELAHIYLEVWPLFSAWGNGLKEVILTKLMDGEILPGLKPVRGNGKRSWSLDEPEVIKRLKTAGLLKKDYEQVSILSPTQAEAAIKKVKPKDYKKRYEKLATAAIEVLPGGPTIAKEHDKGESIAPVATQAEEGFDAADASEELDFL